MGYADLASRAHSGLGFSTEAAVVSSRWRIDEKAVTLRGDGSNTENKIATATANPLSLSPMNDLFTPEVMPPGILMDGDDAADLALLEDDDLGEISCK